MRHALGSVFFLALGGCANFHRAASPTNPPTPPTAAVTLKTDRLETAREAVTAPAAQVPRAATSPTTLFSIRETAPEESLRCPEVLESLRLGQPRTLADALSGLTKLRPRYFTRTTYAFEALHDGAGTGYPRAMVYGGDARTVMTFNGHPKQKGYERLQLMCFNDEPGTFEFSEVVFPSEAASPEAIADLTPEERAQNFVVTAGRGTRECRQCHDLRARPIWDSADVWPGVYGGVNDSLFDADAPDTRPIYGELERRKWSVFKDQALRRGRYQFTSNLSARPNSDLTHQLSHLNGRRVVGDLQRLGDRFTPLRFAFANALLCAPRGEPLQLKQSVGPNDEGVVATFAVLPETADGETREMFLSAYYDQMGKEKRNLAMMKRYGLVQPLPKERFEELRAHYRKLFREENLDLRIAGVDVDQILSLREIKRVVEPLGIDVENWSMTFHGGYNFDNGAAAPGRTALRSTLERPFAEAFLGDDPMLLKAIAARERAEEAGAPAAATQDQEICGLVQRHLVPGPKPASVTE